MSGDFWPSIILFLITFSSGFLWGRLWEWFSSRIQKPKRP